MKRPSQTSTNADVRTANRLEIINYFREHAYASRSDLAEKLQLSPASITNITNQLLDDGALVTSKHGPEIAGPSGSSGHGRPRVSLKLNPNFRRIASCVMSFNGVYVEICDYTGQIIGSAHSDIIVQNMRAEEITQVLLALIKEAQPESERPLSCVSISTQGETTAQLDRLLWSPILFEDALDFPQLIAEALDCQVNVANDASMIAMGYGEEQDNQQQHFGAILLSYGIGLGLQLDGRPFTGIRSSATELGHMPYITGGAKCRCGKQGCIEAYASDYAIFRRSNDISQSELIADRVTPDEIDVLVARAQDNDASVKRALYEAANALGFALASVFSLFDVFPVVFVGPAARLVPLLEQQLRVNLRENFRGKKRVNFQFTIEEDDLRLSLQGNRIFALRSIDSQVAELR